MLNCNWYFFKKYVLFDQLFHYIIKDDSQKNFYHKNHNPDFFILFDVKTCLARLSSKKCVQKALRSCSNLGYSRLRGTWRQSNQGLATDHFKVDDDHSELNDAHCNVTAHIAP